MSEKVWIKNEFDLTPGGDFVPLDGLGFLSACYNVDGAGDMLLLDLVDVQMLQDQANLDLIREFVNTYIGITYRYISLTVLQRGMYQDRGYIFRDASGSFILKLDHEKAVPKSSAKSSNDEIAPEVNDQPRSYEEKLADEDYMESIAALAPEEFVTELGLDWQEVQTRFHANRGNISRNRTDLWIKQCVLYGDAEQRDIAVDTASPAWEGLVRTELSETDLPIIIATKQSIAYIKSREVVAKGELFVWEDLGGNRKVRGKYATSEGWKNRTALKEGGLKKQDVRYLLTLFYGLANEAEIGITVDYFTENAGYEEFTDLIFSAQTALGDEAADGVLDADFIATMKEMLEIGDEPDAITVAYLAYRYLYGGIDWETLQSGMPGPEVLPDYTPATDALRLDESYVGIPSNLPKTPTDSRNQGALSGIESLIRSQLPAYAELENDDPAFKKMVDRIFTRASTLSMTDLKTGIDQQLEESSTALADRISALHTYFEDIQLKQFREMVETYTGLDIDAVQEKYQLWGKIYLDIALHQPEKEVFPTVLTGNFITGNEYLGQDQAAIMKDLRTLAQYLNVSLPAPDDALAIKKQLLDRAAMLADYPLGYQELNDYEQAELHTMTALLSYPGPAKYMALWQILTDAFYDRIRLGDHLPETTRQRLIQDQSQLAQLGALSGLEYEFEAIAPIPNYMFIASSYEAELKAARLDHINRSQGFSIPIFRARRKGQDHEGSEVLILFTQPGDYRVMDEPSLKACFELAEARNLFPPGKFRYELNGVTDEITSNEDWQWSEILAMIGIGLAILAAVAAAPFTGGASTAAVPYLTAAAIGVGAASSVFAIKEASDIGKLDAGVAMFEVGMIVASIIPLLGTGGRILRGTTGYARLGTLGKMTRFVTSAPVQRLGAGAGLVMTVAGAYMFASTLLDQLDAIAEIEDPTEKDKAMRKLIRFAALTGLMLFVAAKSDFIMVRSGVKVGLHSSVKTAFETRQKAYGYTRQIRSRMFGRSHVTVFPPAQWAKIIYLQWKRAGVKLSTIRERAEVKALNLSDSEFAEAYKLAKHVDEHLAKTPKSIYKGKEEELFGKLMEGKLKFNATGKLVAVSQTGSWSRVPRSYSFNGYTFDKNSCPVHIPTKAKVDDQLKPAGYTQVRFRWNSRGFKYEARWHTRTPGAPSTQANTWVVTRTTPGNSQGLKKKEHVYLGNGKWCKMTDWMAAVNARKTGTASTKQENMLTRGHHASY
jgi:hypothetical protein